MLKNLGLGSIAWPGAALGAAWGELCANAWDSQAKAHCADAQTHDLLQQNVTVGRRWLGRLRMAMR